MSNDAIHLHALSYGHTRLSSAAVDGFLSSAVKYDLSHGQKLSAQLAMPDPSLLHSMLLGSSK